MKRTRHAPSAQRATAPRSSLGSATAGPRGPAPAPPAQDDGWLHSAGAWVADKYDSAASAVGGAVDRMGTAAGDLLDVARASDVDLDLGAGTVNLSTDMDEVMDLMPEATRQAWNLDRTAEGANEVDLTLDYRNNTVTAHANDLHLLAVNTGDVTATGATLKDVTLVIQGDGGLPVMGGAKTTTVDVSVASVVAEGLTANTVDGPLTADRLSLSAFAVSAKGDGRTLPTGETMATARFSVGNAVLDGVSGGQGAADQLAMSDIAGDLNRQQESLHSTIGGVQATGASGNGNQLGTLAGRGIQLDVSKGADGDSRSVVSAQHASAGDITMADGAHVGGVSGAGLSVASQGKTLSLAAQEVSARHVRGADGSTLGSANAQNLDLDVTRGEGESWQSRVGVGSGSVRDLKSDGLSLKAGDFGGVSGSIAGGRSASNIALDVASLKGAGLTVGQDVSVDTLTSSQTHLDLAGTDVGLSAGTSSASGLRAGAFSGGTVTASGYDYRAAAGDQRFRADHVAGTDLTAGDSHVAALSGHGADVSLSGDAVHAKVAGLDATDAQLGIHTHMGHLSAQGLDLTAQGETVDGAVQQVHGDDLTIGEAGKRVTAQAVDVDGATVSVGPEHLSASADRVAASRLGGDHGTATAAELNALSLSTVADASDLSVASGSLTGAKTKGASAAHASVTGLRAHQDAHGASARLAAADATGLQIGDSTRIASAHAGTLAGSRAGQTTQVSAGDIAAKGLTYNAGTTHTSVGAARVQGAHATLGPNGPVGGADVLSAQNITGKTTLPGGDKATGTGPVDLSQLSASARVHLAEGNLDLGNTASMVRSGGALVDSADIDAHAPLAAHDYGAVKVRDGTQLDAHAAVRDGRLTDDTRATFSKDLDGPLWIGGHGAYLKDGALKADLSGFFDLDAGAQVAPQLGLDKWTPDVGALSAGAANQMPGDKTPGDATQISLAKSQRAGDNEVNVTAGHEQIVASFSRFLTSALKLDVGGTTVRSGAGAVEGAKVTVDSAGGDTQVSGAIGSVTVRNVRAGG